MVAAEPDPPSEALVDLARCQRLADGVVAAGTVLLDTGPTELVAVAGARDAGNGEEDGECVLEMALVVQVAPDACDVVVAEEGDGARTLSRRTRGVLCQPRTRRSRSGSSRRRRAPPGDGIETTASGRAEGVEVVQGSARHPRRQHDALLPRNDACVGRVIGIVNGT